MKDFLILGTTTCPYCERAKNLVKARGYTFEYVTVDSAADLIDLVPGARTVPQIFYKGLIIDNQIKADAHVGGFDQLASFIDKLVVRESDDSPEAMLSKFKDQMPKTKKKRTVFNAENTGHLTGNYPLFFGDELGLTDTITRPYPVLEDLYQAQLAQIWNEFEVDLTQDRQDMLSADPELVETMQFTILWQSLADSVASRSIASILSPYISNADLEGWYNIVQFFETIHSRTYQHIIKQTFVDPTKAISDCYANMEVLKRANVLVEAFDNIIALDENSSEEDKKEAVYLGLAALYMLEGLNFMASFAITFGIVNNASVMAGIGENVRMICRDEMLHALGGREIWKILEKQDPETMNRIRPKLQELYDAIVQGEYDWTDHLFSDGRSVPRLNADLVKQYVDYMGQPIAETLKVKCKTVDKNPLPYMDKFIDTSKVQNAMQEKQSGSYLINAILAPKDLDGCLNRLKEKYKCRL